MSKEPIFRPENLHYFLNSWFVLARLFVFPAFFLLSAALALSSGYHDAPKPDYSHLARAGAFVVFLGITYVFLELGLRSLPLQDLITEVETEARRYETNFEDAIAARRFREFLAAVTNLHPRYVLFSEWLLLSAGTLTNGFPDYAHWLLSWFFSH